ncbi:phage/plasmid replication domain-containing protein [Chitinimonas taiwanensis]|uniref:Phage X family protein n=1 Tax=Chitinimonas taiwanensis DSM 18899 TaxID=1121279 RepID=A0A1K2HLE5_9NEIS|nr:phage/plasmid replication protein [Chitinimonas taiwanensis]SFZ77614.1 Phage X family protein [Chitinimonas taiwanensis DSM 18899]
MTVFVDFIRISQVHPGVRNDSGEFGPAFPRVDSGFVTKYTRDEETGELDCEWQSTSRRHIEGSFDSLVVLHSDGYKVTLEGNIGRYGRPDNVFNFDFDRTIDLCNRLCALHGLPPFTPGQMAMAPNPSKHDLKHGLLFAWTGAVVSELHLTQNHECGSMAAAQAAIDWLNTQSMSHVKKGRGGPTTVSFGGGKNSRKKVDFYLKAPEMLAHPHGRKKTEILEDPVYQYCHQNGVLRAELKAKRLLLRDAGLRYLGDITMSKLEALYHDEIEILSRTKADVASIDLTTLPPKVRATADSWLRGGIPSTFLSRTTLWRHAKMLRDYGIDIMQPHDPSVPYQPITINVIQIKPIDRAPDWYWPHQHKLRLVVDNTNQLDLWADRQAA